jgi:hypothetical protein
MPPTKAVAWWPVRASAVNAQELLAELGAHPGGRPIPVEPPINSAVVIAGVEVAATPPGPERSLRATWKRRQGGTATPLLLVTDATEGGGRVQVLGPQQAETDLRILTQLTSSPCCTVSPICRASKP